MFTEYLECSDENITKKSLAKAAEILKKGGLVAFPTETVYGLGANGLDGEVVRSIFAVKGRPADNPLILHIAEKKELETLVTHVTPMARVLIDRFWPGPLTVILPCRDNVPKEVTAGLNTVAVRLPEHDIARRLIKLAGVPLAAPSANSSGRPSPTSAAMVHADLAGKIDAIIDAGECEIGLESTVVDCTGEGAIILRPGKITAEMLEQACALQEEKQTDIAAKPRAPGMKYRHYSPTKPVILIGGDGRREHFLRALLEDKKRGKKSAVLVSDTLAEYLREQCRKNSIEIQLVSWSCLRELAKQMYATMVFFEKNSDVIYIESVSESGLGSAIMNRLRKAACEVRM